MSEKITVCIIAKNEENNIFDCIKSVLSLADEIILLDTGSSDKTIQIAQSFNKVKIYQTQWENDFSKAMNQCISYASHDWILCIDADERINDYAQNNLKDYLKNHKFKDNSLIIKFNSININSNRFTQNYYKCGIFRNNRGMHFIIPVHQYLVNEKNDIIIELSNQFQFYHVQSSTKESIISRNKKYIEILINFLNNPSCKGHEFYCYRHLGDSYHDLEKYDKAIDYYIKSYNSQKIILKNFFYVENLLRLAKDILFKTFEYDRALPFIEELVFIAPNLKESLFYYAYVNHRLGNFDKAIEYYNKSLEIKSEFLEIQILGELGRCYITEGKNKLGLEFLERSYKINPKTYIASHLIKYYALNYSLEKILEYESLKYGYSMSYTNEKIKEIKDISKKEYAKLIKLKLEYLSNISGWDSWELQEIRKNIMKSEKI